MATQASSAVRLPVSGGAIALATTSAAATPSLHDGAEIWTLTVEGPVTAALASEVSDLLASGAGTQGGLTDADGTEWRVGTWSSSHTGEASDRYFQVELTQRQTVVASTVNIDGIEVTPLTYEETPDDETEALVIVMRADLDPQSTVGLIRLHSEQAPEGATAYYFDVVRHGIEDRPRTMRLGRVLWQRDGDTTKVSVALVEAKHDEAKLDKPFLSQIAEPYLTHALRWSASADDKIDALLGELAAAGVLDEAAVGRVRTAGDVSFKRRRWAAVEVDNVDEWN